MWFHRTLPIFLPIMFLPILPDGPPPWTRFDTRRPEGATPQEVLHQSTQLPSPCATGTYAYRDGSDHLRKTDQLQCNVTPSTPARRGGHSTLATPNSPPMPVRED